MDHLLTLVIFTPVIFAGLALLARESVAKWICLVGAALTLALSVPLCTGYSSSHRASLADDAGLFKQATEQAMARVGAATDPNGVLFKLLQQKAAPSDADEAYLRGAEGGLWASYQAARPAVQEFRMARENGMAEAIKYVEYADWIPSFNIRYFIGVDGLSLPLVFLTALLTLLCLIYSWNFDGDKPPSERRPLKAFFILFMLLETGLIGVFCALDMFLFYVFWEVVLLPSYFLIGIWGGPNRNYAALKFFIYTLVGSVLMLIAMLALYFNSAPQTFNMLTLVEMSAQGAYTPSFQAWIFVAMFAGFAIKVPVFPFHTWLPDAHVQAPTAFSVMLAGVMLKMGGYGFFRLAYPLCPEAATHPVFVYTIAILGLIGLIYGAFVALGQNDFKSLVAYSSVSHMGYVMLGLAALTPGAMTGAALQMFNHGVSSALMFFLVGIIYDRAHHRDLDRFGGLALQMPWYTGIAMIGFFASLGLPGLNGFISEFLVFFGVYQSTVVPKWMIIAAVPGIVLTAVYVLWTIKRVFLGELTNDKYKSFTDMNFNECCAVWPLAIICIAVGVYPRIILDVMQPAMDAILGLVIGG
jgi:NADH-quinone oxidoreductase subunit M